MKYYMVFDGRATYDIDSAMVMECLGEMTEQQAIKEFKREWGGMDCCLFSYDADGDSLINQTRVYV